MSRAENFDEFYHGTRASVLLQTYALTGDLDGAASAVEHGYARAWSHWAKVAHLDDPSSWVLSKAWRAAGGRRFRRRIRDAERTDSEYADQLRRLGMLSDGERRVVVLHHLAELPLHQIGRQVGVTQDTAGRTLASAEASWSDAAEASDLPIGSALRALEADTARVTLRSASELRRSGDRRQRRNVVLGRATAAAVLLGGGSLIAQEPASTAAASAEAESGGLATDSASAATTTSASPTPRPARQLSTNDTLSPADMRALAGRDLTWAITFASSGPLDEDGAYALCQRRTLADPDPDQVVLRQYEALEGPDTRALQVIEESKTERAARRGYAEMESWFAACEQVGVQLVETVDVARLGDQARIVILREGGRRPAYSTVGVVRTGRLTTAVITTTTAAQPIAPEQLVRRLANSVAAVCELGGGDCSAKPRIQRRSAPLPLRSYKGFLSPADLPAVSYVSQAWAATTPTRARSNPSATPCNRVEFVAAQRPRARVFVVPEARNLPRSFGLSETVGTFATPEAAAEFVGGAAASVDGCSDREINATVADQRSFETARLDVRIWRFEFEISDGATAVYRVGLAQRGRHIAQVTLSPTQRYDVAPEDFRALVVRAGQRLAALS